MYERTSSQPDPGAKLPPGTQAAATFAVIAILVAAFAFVPARDPTEVVPGIACSVLSESDISTALRGSMRLMPTDGTVCRYVSVDGNRERTLIVVARHESSPGSGPALFRRGATMFVRDRSRTYGLVIVPTEADSKTAYGEEMRLADLIHQSRILARNP